MGLVSIGFVGSATVVDAGGNRSTLRFALTAEDLAGAATDMSTIVGRLVAVTEGLVQGYSVGQRYEDDTDVYGPEGSQIENQALVTALIDTSEFKTVSLRIPAPISGMFVDTVGPNANVIDQANAALQAYLSTFEDGGLATVSDGEVIRDSAGSGNFTGRRVHRQSSKG
jgi:hypothetical protein